MLLHLLPYFPSFSLRPEGSGCASKDGHLATNEHTLNRELIISSLLKQKHLSLVIRHSSLKKPRFTALSTTAQ
jgi:hypothetical protein